MLPIRVALSVLGAAVVATRHPVVRAGLRAAPGLIDPRTRGAVYAAVRATAYHAGAAARLVVPPGLRRRK